MQQTALFIDAENISARFAPNIMQVAMKQGSLCYQGAYGHASNLRGWIKATERYHLLQVPVTSNERNATDRCIQNDIHRLFQDGITSFCLVTHDGGYAPCIRQHCAAGCSFTLIGLAGSISHRLIQVSPTVESIHR